MDASVVASGLGSAVTGFLKLVILAGGVFYAVLVVTSYRTSGPHCHLRIDRKDPVRSIGRLLVWLGVKALTLIMRVAVPLFGMLAEASAEVGEWFLRRHAPETHAAIRARFTR
jgi:hypothetical protein